MNYSFIDFDCAAAKLGGQEKKTRLMSSKSIFTCFLFRQSRVKNTSLATINCGSVY